MKDPTTTDLPPGDSPLLPTFQDGGKYRVIAPMASGVQARLFLCEAGGERVVLRVPLAAVDAEERVVGVIANAPSSATSHLVRCLDFVEVRLDGKTTKGHIFERGGVSLRAKLNNVLRLAPAEALAIHSQVCSAVRALECLGYFHTDLGPSNILVDDNGFVKLCDFGNAVAIADFDLTKYANNRRYGAPAGYAGNPDLFSAGLTLYEAVMGEHMIVPFSAAGELESLKNRTLRHKQSLYNQGRLSPACIEKIAATPPRVRDRLLEALNPQSILLP